MEDEQQKNWQYITALEQVLQTAQQTNDPLREGEAQMGLGVCYYHLQQWGDALPAFEYAVSLFRAQESMPSLGSALLLSATVLIQLHRYQQAIPLLEEALSIAQTLLDTDLEFACLSTLGYASIEAGYPEQAIAYHQEVLEAVRRTGDPKTEVHELGKLGIAYALLKREREAMDVHTQALALARRIGYLGGVAFELGNLGCLHTDHLDQPEQGIPYLEEALAAFRLLGDQENEAQTLMNIAGAQTKAGHPEKALTFLSQARTIASALGNRDLLARIASHEGIANDQSGATYEALLSHQRALFLDRGRGDRHDEIEDMSHIGLLWREQGYPDDALKAHQQALQLAREQGDRLEEAQQLGNVASDLHVQGRVEEGILYNQRALTLFRELGNLLGEGRTCVNMGTAYLQIDPWDEMPIKGNKGLCLAYWRLGQWLLDPVEPLEARHVTQKIDGLKEREQAQTFQRLFRRSETHLRWLHFKRVMLVEEAPLLEPPDLSSLDDEPPTPWKETGVEASAWKEAQVFYERLSAHVEATPLLFAQIQGTLGYIWAHLKEWEKSIVHLEQACTAFHALGDTDNEVKTLLNLGKVRLLADAPQEAAAALRKVFSQTSDDQQSMAIRLLCLAYRRLEYTHDAKSLLEGARTRAREREDKQEEDFLLTDLGLTCLELGYPQKAISYLEQAERKTMPDQLCLLAQAYAVGGKFAKARKVFAQAEPLFLALGDQTSAAQICLYLGLTCFFEGHMPEFLAHVRRAFDLTGQNARANARVQQLLDQIALRMRKDPGSYEILQKESNRYYRGF